MLFSASQVLLGKLLPQLFQMQERIMEEALADDSGREARARA